MKYSEDIRFKGNISFQMSLTSTCLMISKFSLCGIPFLAGFYSKDLILEIVKLSNHVCYMVVKHGHLH